MIDRSITWLNLLVSAFVAGAVVCVVGLAVSLAAAWGWMRPMNTADLWPVFAAVLCLVSAKRISAQVGAEHERETVRLEAERLRNVHAELAAQERELRLAAPVSPLPATLPATPAPNSDTGPNGGAGAGRAGAWRAAAHRFLVAGETYGFAIRALVGKEVVSWEDWGRIVDCLVAAGVMVARPRAGWAPGWDMPRWLAERHSTPLPHPDADPPAVVLVTTQHATTPAQQAPEGVN
jgi:hypothetical protein